MASRSFKTFVEQELGRFPLFLIYAVLDWMLIGFLFADGLLHLIAVLFAKFFEMRSPCVFCTRVDHVLLRTIHGVDYNESMCEGHKRDVGFLSYCHVHHHLSDTRSMCEPCLLLSSVKRKDDFHLQPDKAMAEGEPCLLSFVEGEQSKSLTMTEARRDGENNDIVCECCFPRNNNHTTPTNVLSSSKNKNGSFALRTPTPTPRISKFMSSFESEVPEEDDTLSNPPFSGSRGYGKVMVGLPPGDHLNEECNKTPTFQKGGKFFTIPLSDSATSTPKCGHHRLYRQSPLEKSEPPPVTRGGEEELMVHHLKRQVRLDRKSLVALCMELDEERSASTVAANNAMAMITRLQAEKAAVQMEALQYQRMMEEQAEYDQEALQVIKEKMARRDEEIKGLKAEIRAAREKTGRDPPVAGVGPTKLRPYSSFCEKPGWGIRYFRVGNVGEGVEDERGCGGNGGDEVVGDVEVERTYAQEVDDVSD